MIKSESIGLLNLLKLKIVDLGLLTKFKLTSMVVFSALVGYMVSLRGVLHFDQLLILGFGGFFITGAANTLNEIFEKDFDSLMNRTKNRPLAAGRMNVSEAVLWAGIFCLTGTFLLLTFNLFAGLLGMLSLVLYSFIYTPLKRFTPISVWVGALPGALPVLIGGVAASGYVTPLVFCLFTLQVIWQFPHFWAIAWVADDDYKAAGFKLLPSEGGEKNKSVGMQAFAYTVVLFVAGFIPFYLGLMSMFSSLLIGLVALYFGYRAFQLLKNNDNKSARTLMFASFIYLPLILLVFIVDKFWLS